MQAIETKFHAVTNSNGARISATCEAKRIIIGIDDGLSIEANHGNAAKILGDRMGWVGEMVGGGLKGHGMAWVFVDSRAGLGERITLTRASYNENETACSIHYNGS